MSRTPFGVRPKRRRFGAPGFGHRETRRPGFPALPLFSLPALTHVNPRPNFTLAIRGDTIAGYGGGQSRCVTSDEQLIRRATAALEKADWETAKRLFANAIDRRETPEALEGLARAAFFLNEGEAALEARERAYARYRDADRPVVSWWSVA